MNLERFLLHSLCALALVGCAQKEQSNTNPNLLRAQETLDSLYQNYSQPDGNLLRENYPFDQQNTVTYLASEERQICGIIFVPLAVFGNVFSCECFVGGYRPIKV